jgi:hypothetical protein
MENSRGIILTVKNRITRRETSTSAILSTINPTWTEPGANPGLSSERPATNFLSHVTGWLVGWLIGDHLLLRDFGPYGIIFEYACPYNRCHGNSVEGFWTLLDNIRDYVFTTLFSRHSQRTI